MNIFLILSAICLSLGANLILQAHYKPWESTSTKYLYDYSLKSHHITIVALVANPIVSTDRYVSQRSMRALFSIK